jgi:hypothetical protein
MQPKEWTTVPMLPCVSLDDTIAFWQILKYTTTYYQKSPYPYGVVERGGHQLHFYRLKTLKPAETYQGCLIMVGNAEAVHREFCESLRTHTGKVPNTGLPRISRMKPGQTRFTITDPSGNAVIFVSLGEKDQDTYAQADKPGLTPLQKSIAVAIRFRDYKNDEEAAAKTLDAGLKRKGVEQNIDTAEALLMRADLARELQQPALEKECYEALKVLHLTPQEIKLLREKGLILPL